MFLDVRAIANFVLDEAAAAGVRLTNISINKIVYFICAEHLAKFGQPLVKAKIEAWKYGPVFRELYSEFKVCQDRPIEKRAEKINPHSGKRETCRLDSEEPIVNDLRIWCRTYMRLSASQLVELSHAEDGPWDRVFFHGGTSNPGMHISDEVIRESFRTRTRH